MFFPLTAKSGSLAIHAADAKGVNTADGTLTIRGFADNRVPISKVQGDNQTGPPGALLPLSLRVALRDSSGDARGRGRGDVRSLQRRPTFAGRRGHRFQRPGRDVRAAAGHRGSHAGARRRALDRIGPRDLRTALGGVHAVQFPEAASRPGTPNWATARPPSRKRVRCSRRSPPSCATTRPAANWDLPTAPPIRRRSISSSPATVPPIPRESRPATASSPIRIRASNSSISGARRSSRAARMSRWRPPPRPPSQTWWRRVRRSLISLALSLNGAPAGGHFVVATGIAADGSVVIQDPSPLFARTNLDRLSRGLQRRRGHMEGRIARGREVCAAQSAIHPFPGGGALPARRADAESGDRDYVRGGRVRHATRNARQRGFGGRAAGRRSAGLAPHGLRRRPAGLPARNRRRPAFRAQLTDLAPGGSFTDLSGSAPATYQASRPQFYLAVGTAGRRVSRPSAVVNGATFAPGIAPGGVVSIFGVGLAGPGKRNHGGYGRHHDENAAGDAVPDQRGSSVSNGTRRAFYSCAIGLRVGATDGYGFGGGSGYLLDRQSADRGDYESELQSDRAIQPAAPRPGDGYLCHRAGRRDTERPAIR